MEKKGKTNVDAALGKAMRTKNQFFVVTGAVSALRKKVQSDEATHILELGKGHPRQKVSITWDFAQQGASNNNLGSYIDLSCAVHSVRSQQAPH